MNDAWHKMPRGAVQYGIMKKSRIPFQGINHPTLALANSRI